MTRQERINATLAPDLERIVLAADELAEACEWVVAEYSGRRTDKLASALAAYRAAKDAAQ